MMKSRFNEEPFIYALRLAESGTLVTDVCRQLDISEATFYVWKKKYASLGVAELCQLRELQEENSRLQRLVAELTLDKEIFSEVIRKEI
ncbi:putative transposase [Luteibacter jiangsuensis]|uniref:Transposase n=1 Tax=Luteibacter jiangsuensis TaxID=637577 RepID=A0ABT9T199_9GAMM|nr:transposase [Luteibacter jiangsuensis]MDQ0010386.1 putative transposase [Luteibacter jiangsuensis]